MLKQLVLAASVGWMAPALAASPRFDAYAAPVRPGSTQIRVVLSGPESRRYAAELESAGNRPVNFAGHYILAIWGCGASCVMGAAIDVNTGAVSWLPFTVCCWSSDFSEPLEFKAGSRLLVVHGSRNENGGGTHYYVYNNDAFAVLPVRR